MPQKAFEGGILHVRAYAILPEMPQNRTYLLSVLFSFSNRSHAFFLEMPHFFYVRFSWNATFSHLILKIGKMGHFRKNDHKKVGHFEKKHAINFKTGKAPKLIMFDFGAFQEKLHMLSRAKYLLHILFGAFQEKSTWTIWKREKNQKWIFSILGHFRKKMHMLSRAKSLLHIHKNISLET